MKAEEVSISAANGVVQKKQSCSIVYKLVGEPVKIQSFSSAEGALAFLMEDVLIHEKHTVWVDLEGCTDEQSMTMLNELFPDMQPSQVELVLAPHAYDAVELEPIRGSYLVGSLACACTQRRCASEEDDENVVPCNFACSDQTLLTVHAAPFVGLAEVMHYVKTGGGCVRRDSPSGDRARELEGCDAVDMMRGSVVLCALICFTCETYLPNPTGLISEVDSVNEMVMLVAPGKQDQTDFLRRISVLRRHMSAENARLYLKEKLLQELMGPTMRTRFVSSDPDLVDAYRRVFTELSQVLERMEIARDTLNHVNLNFIAVIAMRMSQASAGFDHRMTFISQIVTVCLPMNFLASLYGMNCVVPWSADDYDNLTCFWSIIGIMVAWMVVCFFQPVRTLLCKGDDDDYEEVV